METGRVTSGEYPAQLALDAEMREKLMKNRLLPVFLGIVLLFSAVSADTAAAENGYLTLQRDSIDYEGETYYLKRRIHSVLIMGIDQWEELSSPETAYRHGGQADFLLLVIVDDDLKTVSVLPINRDSMCTMKVLNIFGQEVKTQEAQICLAFSYGDGKKESAELEKDAVSTLLKGTKIDHYYALKLDGIRLLNDWLGGIEVTLADDFSMYDPQMKAGETIRLSGDQAEIFLRYRYEIADSSNTSRMQRQKQYAEKARLIFAEKLNESASNLLDLLELLSPFAETDMNYGYEINLANRMNQYTFIEPYSISGTNRVEKNGSNAFYPDDASLMEALLACFYEKA